MAKEIGMRLIAIITLFLVILKVADVISWNWVWVVSPMWGMFILGVVVLFINDITEAKIERQRSDEEGAE